jgi:hypothetical protein
MSNLYLTRPDVCSIRAAAEQVEFGHNPGQGTGAGR